VNIRSALAVDSAGDQIISTLVQCVIKSFQPALATIFVLIQKKSLQKQFSTIKNRNFKKLTRSQMKIYKKICENLRTKNGSAYAQLTRKFSKIETQGKIDRKESKFFSSKSYGPARF
jgi:hypothetical protein